MKKTFIALGMALLSIVVCFSFAACSGGGSEKDEPENPEDNLPETSKQFVGFWVPESTSYGVPFLFSSDGNSCSFSNTSYEVSFGYWTYNDKTQILATTNYNWQFSVNLSNANAWAGVTLNTGKTVNYERGDTLRYINYLLSYKSTWINDTTDLHFSRGQYVRHVDKKGKLALSGKIVGEDSDASTVSRWMEFEKNGNKEYSFQYKIKYYGYRKVGKKEKLYEFTYATGTFTVNGASTYDPAKMSLTFTGGLKGTLRFSSLGEGW